MMAGDLEDFLKRAAERRQAKTQQQQTPPQTAQRPTQPPAQQPAQRPVQQTVQQTVQHTVQRPPVLKQAPPYTDRRRERTVRDHDEHEPILVAEVVDTPDGMAKRRQAVKDAKTKSDKVVADATAQLAALRKASGESDATSLMFTGDPKADLVRLLRQPGGLKQAILLREILDRPVDRW